MKADLSDLKAQFDWAEAHPVEARRIAEAGRAVEELVGATTDAAAAAIAGMLRVGSERVEAALEKTFEVGEARAAEREAEAAAAAVAAEAAAAEAVAAPPRGDVLG